MILCLFFAINLKKKGMVPGHVAGNPDKTEPMLPGLCLILPLLYIFTFIAGYASRNNFCRLTGLGFLPGWTKTKRGSQEHGITPAVRGFPCNEHFTYAFLIHLNYAARLSTGYINVLRVFLLGYWSITVYGRKHCYRLYTKHFNEAVHWACATQKIIDTKAPVETPTQLLIRDIEVGHSTQQHPCTVLLPNDLMIWATKHIIPSLLCHHGNHIGSGSKVSSACPSLFNDLIVHRHIEKNIPRDLKQNHCRCLKTPNKNFSYLA